MAAIGVSHSGSTNDMIVVSNRRKNGKNSTATARRRCRMACIPCRNRKVRCDVEQQDNAPCTNCRLDQEACIIQNRVRQSKIAYQQNYNLSTPNGLAAWSALQKSVAQNNPPPDAIVQRPEIRDTTPSDLEDLQSGQNKIATALRSPCSMSLDEQLPFQDRLEEGNLISVRKNGQEVNHRSMSISSALKIAKKAEIGHYYYPFLVVDKVSQLPLDDLQYLESISCFQVPVRHLLDEIMKAYFLYVHPHLPVLNEAEFWTMYSDDASKGLKLSLFIFHAMISTALGFVPDTIVRQLGFKDIRSARNSFYRRAKALYHMDTNRNIISSAQGCLILTYYVTTNDARLNTYWLSNAICFARLAIGPSRLPLYAKNKEGTELRRLWWCCLARDMIMSVALRRSVHIGPDELPCPSLEGDDICWDLENSEVYDWDTKQVLLASFTALCELVVILADVTVFLATTKADSRTSLARYQPQVCSQRLDEWYLRTKERLRLGEYTAESAHLHANVIYIYYHSSNAALWNHAIYTSVVEKVPMQANFAQGRMRLESALRGIDDSLKGIQQVGLLHCMPLAISAFIALPMVWHIMSTKLSRGSTAIEARSRLSFYFSAMNAFKIRSESTDAVLYYIKQLVSCFRAAEHATPDTRSKKHQNIRSRKDPEHWTDVLTNQPQYFIRSTLTVELALSTGQYPVEADFPSNLTNGEPEVSPDENVRPQEPSITPLRPTSRSNCNQVNDPFSGSETPAMWTLGIFDSTSEGLDSRQAQLQDVLFRFEQADYNNPATDLMQFQSPSETGSAFFNDMMNYLECV